MSLKAFVLRRAGEVQTLHVDGRRGGWRIDRGEQSVHAQVARMPDGRLSVLLSDGRQVSGRVRACGRAEIEVSTARGAFRLSMADPLHDRVDHARSAPRSGDEEIEIRALMPGRVVAISVASGDRIEPGVLLLVVEAMKMQNEIRAEHTGVVTRIAVEPGQTADGGALLLTIRLAAG